MYIVSSSPLLLVLVVSLSRQIWTAQAQTCSAADGTCMANLGDFPSECGLYMAESTIPGAGIGIFTAVPKEPGDVVGTGDVCLPVMDMSWHNPEPYYNPFGDYFWAGDVMGMGREVASDDIEAYCPGLDCAINCNLALINVQKSVPQYDEAGLHRSKDPGVGAFTPYHNGTTLVSRKIPAGGELFKFYGDNWFETREDIFGPDFPLSDDFPTAQRLLSQLMDLKLDDELLLKDTYGLLTSLKGKPFDSRTLGALPNDFDDAMKAAEDEIAVLYQPAATRSIDWLRENGRCIDNIVPGYSTLKQAARGAFATRPLKKDQIITTSPLHHLPNGDFVNMYEFEKLEDGEWLRHVDQITEKQIVLNYCYGHKESTLLLCPYGSGINYINHNQTQANIKIRWAENFELGHNAQHLKNGTVEELMWNYKPQFSFDYVALRDIDEGEEFFLDYGDDFEQAWQEHVENYQPLGDHPDRYVSGHSINTQFPEVPLRTVAEQEWDPYPDHLQMRCHDKLKRSANPLPSYTWKTNTYGYPCRILDRFIYDNELFYTVELEVRPDHDEQDRVKWIERTDVPRSGIHFFEIPGMTDLHLPNAFRHWIDIPDDMFPEQWKNNKVEEES